MEQNDRTREKLIEIIQSAVGGCATYWAGLIADALIANGATIPVRCEGCKYYIENQRRCDHPCLDFDVECFDHWLEMESSDFCSYGERTTDG